MRRLSMVVSAGVVSMTSSRERMLAKIRASLGHRRAELVMMAGQASHVPPPFVHAACEDMVGQFADELTRQSGRPCRCADDAAACDVIGDLLREQGARRVMAWSFDQIGVAGLAERLAADGVVVVDGGIGGLGAQRSDRLEVLESVPVGISGADLGIAESGTLVLVSGPGRGRLASLLAPVHVAVLRAEQVVRGLGVALATLTTRYGPDIFLQHSNVTLITGPSRTADIELTLTLGVHGPREVYVVLIG